MGVSPPSQPSSLDTQQMAYQQAFLQNAVAQNMQIQQQLMLQNQALTQLLSSSNTGKYFQFSSLLVLKRGLLEF